MPHLAVRAHFRSHCLASRPSTSTVSIQVVISAALQTGRVAHSPVSRLIMLVVRGLRKMHTAACLSRPFSRLAHRVPPRLPLRLGRSLSPPRRQCHPANLSARARRRPEQTQSRSRPARRRPHRNPVRVARAQRALPREACLVLKVVQRRQLPPKL